MTFEIDHAWAAGFFDGEGYVGVVPRTKNDPNTLFQLKLNISQNLREPLDKFVSLYGGSVTRKSGTDAWVWQSQSRAAELALNCMYPYLIVKREQAKVALAFQARRTAGPKLSLECKVQDRLDSELMKALKRKKELV